MDELRFEGHYSGWRKTRVDKLVSILGKDWFIEKSILEVGAGFGHVGKMLTDLGSTVVCAEGRAAHVGYMKIIHPQVYPLVLDLDTKWDLHQQFDLVIHWGVLYHINNWKADIGRAIKHAPIVCLETEVSDSFDPTFEMKVEEEGHDQALNRIGTRPSAAHIEAVIASYGASFKRYDDADINHQFHRYDWEEKGTNTWDFGQRRFWMIYR